MRIGIDIDDVLFNTTFHWIEYCNKKFKLSLNYEEKQVYSLGATLNKTEEEGINSFEDFCKTKYFLEMKPVNGAIDTITKLSKKHELIIITSRNKTIEQETRESINKYFKDKFKQIHITENHLGIKTKKTKYDVCKENNCTLLIEDAYHHAIDCAEKGIQTLLYNRPWNEKEQLHLNMKRVYNWEEILKILN